jgi:5'-nucleotidase
MRGYALDGTPVDCVKAALAGVFGRPPNAVVSGLNDGENSGVDVHTSGTIAAVREAAIAACPGVALSLVRGAPDPLERYASLGAALVERLFASPPPREVFYAINLPACAADTIRGARVTRQGLTAYRDRYEQSASAGGQLTLRLTGGVRDAAAELDSDTAAVAAGWIAVTPMTIDASAYAVHAAVSDLLATRQDGPA